MPWPSALAHRFPGVIAGSLQDASFRQFIEVVPNLVATHHLSGLLVGDGSLLQGLAQHPAARPDDALMIVDLPMLAVALLLALHPCLLESMPRADQPEFGRWRIGPVAALVAA